MAAESLLALKEKCTMEYVACYLETIAYINTSLYGVRIMVF